MAKPSRLQSEKILLSPLLLSYHWKDLFCRKKTTGSFQFSELTKLPAESGSFFVFFQKSFLFFSDLHPPDACFELTACFRLSACVS